jgi:ABC-type transport system substrate-binding protein
MTVIAPPYLEVQAIVVSKMLEQIGLTVQLQLLEASAYNRKTFLSELEQPPEHQAWDMALTAWSDTNNFAVFNLYEQFALNGQYNWVIAQPELRRLYEQVLHTVDREHQERWIRQMERHTSEQAYFLFLYNPIQIHAVNKAVELVPYVSTTLNLTETSVTEEHWSMRKQKAGVQE